MRQSLCCKFVLPVYVEKVEHLLKKNNILYKFTTINDNLIKLLYLEEYEYSKDYYCTPDYQKYVKLSTEAEDYFINFNTVDVADKFISRSIKTEDITLFENLSDIRYFYFIFDTKDSSVIKAILKDKFNITIEMYDLDLENERYAINGLSYYEIIEDRFKVKGNSIVNAISHVFHDCNISYCIYADMNSKITLRNEVRLEIRAGFFYRLDLKSAFKSSWEANIARIFNYKNIEWEYEKTSFERYRTDGSICGYYFPDFFLDNNIIMEVKGFWNPDSRSKAMEFKKHYTQYRYLTIDGDMYFTLKDRYSSLIPEWEENETEKSKEETLQIVGLNFGVRKQTFKTLKVGDNVIFKRDPQNTYDANAILVLTNENNEIGFISSDWAVVYAIKIDLGMTFDAKIISIEPKVINIKVKRNNPEAEILYDFLK